MLPLLLPRQKLPPAHNDGDLAAHIHDLLDGLADLDNGVKIDAVTDLAGKRFAAEL